MQSVRARSERAAAGLPVIIGVWAVPHFPGRFVRVAWRPGPSLPGREKSAAANGNRSRGETV
ncbi:hypothetical protein EV560_11311 [Bosea sp. BK604]|nr:hypothetical protein EV560_11311 [Bosea sp. BK604]